MLIVSQKRLYFDWDIMLFRPIIDELLSSSDEYMGKMSLDGSDSFRLRESCEHWRREM